MTPPRWLLVATLLVTDAVAIWMGIDDAVAASFLLVLAGVSATLALTVRPRTAAAVGLALLVPATFLAMMAGPGGGADCGPACAALVEAHEDMVARVAWVLAIGHVIALALAHARVRGRDEARVRARDEARVRPVPVIGTEIGHGHGHGHGHGA